jgi:hypothetical protein
MANANRDRRNTLSPKAGNGVSINIRDLQLMRIVRFITVVAGDA